MTENMRCGKILGRYIEIMNGTDEAPCKDGSRSHTVLSIYVNLIELCSTWCNLGLQGFIHGDVNDLMETSSI